MSPVSPNIQVKAERSEIVVHVDYYARESESANVRQASLLHHRKTSILACQELGLTVVKNCYDTQTVAFALSTDLVVPEMTTRDGRLTVTTRDGRLTVTTRDGRLTAQQIRRQCRRRDASAGST